MRFEPIQLDAENRTGMRVIPETIFDEKWLNEMFDLRPNKNGIIPVLDIGKEKHRGREVLEIVQVFDGSGGVIQQSMTPEQAMELINIECRFINRNIWNTEVENDTRSYVEQYIEVRISDPAGAIQEGDLLVMRHHVKRKSLTSNRSDNYMAMIIEATPGGDHWYNTFTPKPASDYVSKNFVVWNHFDYNIEDYNSLITRSTYPGFRGAARGNIIAQYGGNETVFICKTIVDFCVYRDKKAISTSRNKIVLKAKVINNDITVKKLVRFDGKMV